MRLSAGTRLGPYEILLPIGAGGMGEVYRGRDTRLDRTVAIKVLPAHLSSNADLRARFEREAKSISALQHSNICVLYDVGQESDVDFLVMEYLEGETLAARLARKPLALDEALRIAIEVADALDAAHRRGVIHRDLKPGNIMLTKSGSKLMDFGLAKPHGLAASGSVPAFSAVATMTSPVSPVTAAGTVVGTVQYMSPEQIQGQEVDARSDLFAFGATLYEMLTGKRAFAGKSQLSVASAILEKDPEPVNTLQPLTPPALERVVRKCLAKDPEERWQNTRDLVSELRWIAESGGTVGTAPAGKLAAKGRKRELLVGALAVIFLLAAILSAVSYWRVVRTPARPIIAEITPPDKVRFNTGSFAGGKPVLSPDGRALAFCGRDENGKTMLWVRSLNSLVAHPLSGTDGARDPFWSADGRALGFFAGGQLKTVAASGEPAVAVAAAPDEDGGSWNRDGTILFVPAAGRGLFKVAAAGGDPSSVIAADPAKFTFYGAPRFLPDGKHFLYFAGSRDAASSGTYFASLDGREGRLAVRGAQAKYASGFLLFLRENTLMAQAFDPARGELKGDQPRPVAQRVAREYSSGLFDASENGILIYKTDSGGSQKQLTWFDRAGKNLGVTGEAGAYYDVRLSPDGQKLASNADYPAGSTYSEIWVDELARGVHMRLTIDPDSDHGVPVWSPDSRTIAFAPMDGKLRRGIYQKPANGAGGEELLLPSEDPERQIWPTSWSRDGGFILYSRGFHNLSLPDIWVLPLAGDRKSRPFVQAPAAAYDGQFSPDGRWVAYTSEESGRSEVYVVPFDARVLTAGPGSARAGRGARWEISPSGGRCPRWRRDGKEIFYLSPANQMMAAEIEEKDNTIVVRPPQALFNCLRPVIFSVTSFEPYDVSPDGKKFVINTLTAEDNTPLVLLVNWTANLNQ
jgi:eukaryotic-like serine/threonine-protein kinase